MNKKFLILVLVLIVVLAVVGAFYIFSKNQSPEVKIEQLQQQKTTQVKNSGYEECIQKVKTEEAKREQDKKDCQKEIIKEKGFTDNENCVGTENQNPLCKETPRYNAEVEAINKCMEKFPNDPKQLSEFDCAELLQNK
jgi:predicted Holliday junction resolvase-like endonuclease